MILVIVLISMPATGYTWKGDDIAAPAGPVCCLYTVKQKVYTQCLIRRTEGRGLGGCSCVGGTSYTRWTIKWTRVSSGGGGHRAPKCSTFPNIQSLSSSILPILLMVIECKVYVNECDVWGSSKPTNLRSSLIYS